MRLDWASLLDLLKSRDRFVLTSHVRPDCDALGSELGLAGILTAIGKDVRIVNAQATPPSLAWIDPTGRLESLAGGVRPADLADRDLLVVLDTSAFAQLGAMAPTAAPDGVVLDGVIPDGVMLVALTSIHWREAWKYGERAFRYCQPLDRHRRVPVSVGLGGELPGGGPACRRRSQPDRHLPRTI